MIRKLVSWIGGSLKGTKLASVRYSFCSWCKMEHLQHISLGAISSRLCQHSWILWKEFVGNVPSQISLRYNMSCRNKTHRLKGCKPLADVDAIMDGDE